MVFSESSLQDRILKNIKYLKETKGLTSKQLEESGLARATYNNLFYRDESGYPSVDTMERLSDVFHVDITFFFAEHTEQRRERDYLVSCLCNLYDNANDRERTLLRKMLEAFERDPE